MRCVLPVSMCDPGDHALTATAMSYCMCCQIMACALLHDCLRDLLVRIAMRVIIVQCDGMLRHPWSCIIICDHPLLGRAD